MALVGDEEPRPDLNTLCAKHKSGRNPSAIEYSTCGKDWNIQGINHLRYKRHCMDIPDVSSGFRSFGDNGSGSEFLHLEGVGYGGHDRDHLDPGGLPFLHVGGR